MKPRLVLIAGAPGTGKTTLAERLARDVGLPLLTKDGIKVALYDALGAASLNESQRLGRAAIVVLLHTAAAVLRGGSGLVVESAFLKDVSEGEVAEIPGLGDPLLIRCHCPPELAAHRYKVRIRHPVHRDNERGQVLSARLDTDAYWIELTAATLDIDTSNGYEPSYDRILQAARSA